MLHVESDGREASQEGDVPPPVNCWTCRPTELESGRHADGLAGFVESCGTTWARLGAGGSKRSDRGCPSNATGQEEMVPKPVSTVEEEGIS